jgi:hypothetical protein
MWEPIDVRGQLPTNGEATYHSRVLSGITGVTIHYTAGPSTQTVRQVAAYQTSEAARGQTGNDTPFPGLAYSLFVEGDGRVYLAWDLATRVWHSEAVIAGKARNATHVGICYAGNVKPNAAQMAGLGLAVGWVFRSLARALTIEGHRDAPVSTACPGPAWPAWRTELLGNIR